ncbi:OLC1v1016521C1 [Oldenlandia corymbosa var. corymbosa]|uniref:OLC1v1016521C1 n=1 Tax=Oldenlandia corymbosa var. corymbosa TaxID=529605 RepID=A0AAV1E5U7_OLDCO|nr:OLC1v1016521C1 [Oldenlandia corymbosa var. corymbosa]
MKDSDQNKKGKGIVLKPTKPKWKPKVGVTLKEQTDKLVDNTVSTSGLTIQEKALIPMDVQEETTVAVDTTVNTTEVRHSVQEQTELAVTFDSPLEKQRAFLPDSAEPKQTNRFSALETIEESEDEVEKIYSEVPLINNEKELAGSMNLAAEKEVLPTPVDSTERLLIQYDAQVEYRREEDTDDEINEEIGRRSEGEKEDS